MAEIIRVTESGLQRGTQAGILRILEQAGSGSTNPIDALFATLVPQILAFSGATVTITRRLSTLSPSTRGVTLSDPESQALTCSPPRIIRRLPPGELNLVAGDSECLIKGADLDFDPEVGHTATFGSRVYRIVQVDAIRSGAEIAAYKVFVRAVQ